MNVWEAMLHQLGRRTWACWSCKGSFLGYFARWFGKSWLASDHSMDGITCMRSVATEW